MTRYSRGDVLLLPFPFADTRAEKRRPAIVVSGKACMASSPEIMVAMITSRAGLTPRVGDYRLSDWRDAGLIGPSTVRARLATINSSRVVKRIGVVSRKDMGGIERGLRAALELTKEG